MPKPNTLADFWKRVDKRGPDECWLYQGATDWDGYGLWCCRHKTFRAHRVAFTLSKGEIPEGLCVLHSCDNPPCCNPAHLFPGTNLENVQDRDRKGRQAKQMGDNNGQTKIPDALLPSVKLEYAKNGATLRSVAKQFGVGNTAIYAIVSGQRQTA